MNRARNPLLAARRDFRLIDSPVVLFNKSHSGSRLLARLIEEAGVFLGAHQNESRDSLDVLDLVMYLVGRYYPDYTSLWSRGGPDDTELPDLIHRVFSRHLEGYDRKGGRPWGWKLCETAYIVPVVDRLFPRAKFIHLLRDGRDVAFSDHQGPDNAFWKKIYFNTGRIAFWRGMPLTFRSYRRRSHLFNAQHWLNSVTIGRAHGQWLGERYLEVRYEDLCLDFERTAGRVLGFLGLDTSWQAVRMVRPSVYTTSLQKYLRQPKRKVRQVVEIEKPLLLALGYLSRDPEGGAAPFLKS
jgi:hypothetical protein